MQNGRTWLIARDDTFLGVCEGLGEDFGINPTFFRVAFSVSLLWNPAAVVAAYLGLGAIVMVSRLIVPNPRPATAPEQAAKSGEAEPARDNDNAEALPVAA
ncbi:PspC domain-containing protein [Sphingosinicella sp. CPCC 101087]|uniref:PspC domain-containing protein n=1 Tax=Sphingosinicella sp. CPCC 101087 TaxID=2497754 RepID=UPI00101C69CE|nr:PspC domain-containing protein [Sphingosinicella sp. CPCC 101087]